MTHRGGPYGAPLILFLAVAAAAEDVRSTVGPVETPLPLEAANFLLDHPDLSAWLVNRRKIAPYVVERRSPKRFFADDGDGTKGLITEAERSPTRRVYQGEGTHNGWLEADATVVLQLAPAGPGCVISTFDVGVTLKNRLLGGAVRLLRPWLKDVIARKFGRAFLAAHKVGELLAREPASVSAELASYPKLTEAERAELLRVTGSLVGAAGCPKKL